MTSKTFLFFIRTGCTALFLSFWAAPASAQWFEAPIPPHGIREAVIAQGIRPLSHPYYRGQVYIIDGLDRRGVPVRFVVDAYDGEIVDGEVLGGRMSSPGREDRTRRPVKPLKQARQADPVLPERDSPKRNSKPAMRPSMTGSVPQKPSVPLDKAHLSPGLPPQKPKVIMAPDEARTATSREVQISLPPAAISPSQAPSELVPAPEASAP